MVEFVMVLIIIALSMVPASAQAQMKIGYMNPDSVLRDLPEVATIEAEVQQYIEEREQAFQDRYQSWLSLFSEFSEQVNAGVLSEEEILEKEEELAAEEQELTLLQTRMQNQVSAKQNELFTPVLTKLDDAIRSVSMELGLDMVINRQTGMGDPIIYYAAESSMDITPLVLQHMLEKE